MIRVIAWTLLGSFFISVWFPVLGGANRLVIFLVKYPESTLSYMYMIFPIIICIFLFVFSLFGIPIAGVFIIGSAWCRWSDNR